MMKLFNWKSFDKLQRLRELASRKGDAVNENRLGSSQWWHKVHELAGNNSKKSQCKVFDYQ